MAQLGARLDGIEEVVGSNPIGSTSSRKFFNTTHPLSLPANFCRYYVMP